MFRGRRRGRGRGVGDIVPDWVRRVVPSEAPVNGGPGTPTAPSPPPQVIAPVGPEGYGGEPVAPEVIATGAPLPREQPAVVDGFTMSAALRYLPLRFYPLALADLTNLRKDAARWRCRHLVVPHDNTVTIPFNQALKYTEQVHIGSYIYGYTFVAITGAAGDWRIEVTGACSRAPFFSSAIQAPAAVPLGAAGANFSPILMKPIPVTDPGLLDIRIANMNTATPGRAQLLLAVAEPCYVVEEEGGAEMETTL